MNKKIDEAVKRFGAPDYGRTAKRLRDFEGDLLTPREDIYSYAQLEEANKRGAAHLIQLADKLTRKDREIEALQHLLNEKDYEIDMLRNIKPVSTRDLWIAASLVALVVIGAYYGFM